MTRHPSRLARRLAVRRRKDEQLTDALVARRSCTCIVTVGMLATLGGRFARHDEGATSSLATTRCPTKLRLVQPDTRMYTSFE